MANAPNARPFDLNLLNAFAVIYECGSITRAAERLALSQSATSHALARLRATCDDDLFVRVGQGVVPTPVAKRIYPDVRRALDSLRLAVGEARGFDPATSVRHFNLALPHPMGPLWGLALRGAAQRTAPGVTLRFDTTTLPIDPHERMRSGDLDLCVDWLPVGHDRFVNRKLFEDSLVCVARYDHPRATSTMTLTALRRERYVRVHSRPDSAPPADGDPWQDLLSRDLDWALRVSEYLEVPYVVMQTELMGFVPASVLLPNCGLQIITTPFKDVPIPTYAIWHETRRADAGHRWLRGFVAKTITARQTG